MIPKSMPSGRDPMGGHRFSDRIMRKIKRMIPTRRAALAQSGHRFSRTNGFVCPEIMRKIKRT
jgi:hypothetical protein